MEKIIQGLKAVINQSRLKIDDKTIFEQAVKIYLSKMIQTSKEKNMNAMKSNKEDVNKAIGLEPPTIKQINFLKRTGYTGNMPKTKSQAKDLISRYIKGEQK